MLDEFLEINDLCWGMLNNIYVLIIIRLIFYYDYFLFCILFVKIKKKIFFEFILIILFDILIYILFWFLYFYYIYCVLCKKLENFVEFIFD